MKNKYLKVSVLAASMALCATAAVSAYYTSDASQGNVAPVAVPEAASLPAVEQDMKATWSYDNQAVMDATVALSGAADPGEVKAGDNEAVTMTVVSNGAAFRNNGNNIQVRKGAEFRVPVQSTEDVVTVSGYPGYSYYSIGGGEEIQNTSANPVTTYKAKYADVQRGYVSIVSTNDNNYYYSIAVDLIARRGPVTLDDEAATATFTLAAGTAKQTAEFSNADYFLASKITFGSNLSLDGNDNKGNNQTWFGVASKQSKAGEDNAIRFLIQPKHGLKFTPTKVSFKSTRYGTNGGKLDMAWVNPDGSTVALDNGQTPNRDNATPNFSEYSYDITGATVAEGACGLQINLYSLDSGKRVGFSDLVIEGTLSGTEKEVPMLASFVANGVTYNVDDVFEAEGETYVATIELASSETMISAANPVSDLVVVSGAAGEIEYKGDNDACTVTMPVTLGEITINYIANFVRKPLFTLTYYNTDGSVMGTQQVEKDAQIGEYACDYTTAKVEEGMKVRGWFAQPTYGRKVLTTDVITEPIGLYAVATDIEEMSPYKKYEFDLKNQYFYPEDHEAFSTEAGYWHDSTHGWAFRDGDRISLLVGPKASVSIALCRYGYGTNIVVKDAKGETLATLPGVSADAIDGEIVAFNYEGEGGVITLNFEATGELYIHSVKIVNNSQVNYNKVGQWYYVKPGDAGSLLDVIEAVSADNASRDAERAFVFVPNGVYDLRQTVLTNLSGHNISIIGQSREGTIIRNEPHYTTEGISTTATLMNTGSNNYLQDLTIQNALDYYATIDGKQAGGRAVAWWDKGLNTICKNVTLLSYQDTYYTNNVNGDYYWDNSDIHGTVDFICGEGTLFVENSTLTVEMRNANGKGECTLTAPSTAAGESYGYVFSNCKIDNRAERYNYGRAWSNEPRCAYINTTVSDGALNSERWTANGMNVAAKAFVEYNTRDEQGNVVSPASHVMTFIKGDNVNTMETILSEAEAAEFAIEKVFPDWNPRELAAQVEAPQAVIDAGILSWKEVEGAIGYAIYRNGELLAIVSGATEYVAENHQTGDVYTIRSINSMGGHGVEAAVSAGAGLLSIGNDATVVSTVLYNLQGVAVDETYQGVVVKVNTLSDGSTVITKTINR